jgi:hypothetical protein
MSAFLVSKKHIDALVYARGLNQHRGGRIDELPDNDLGRMLWRENMASLLTKYNTPIDEAELESYHYNPVGVGARFGQDKIGLIKAIHCYQYQACEHDGWTGSKAALYCEALEQVLVRRLPGYDEAGWGID